jgi:hypothetical protein
MRTDSDMAWVDGIIGEVDPLAGAELDSWDLDGGYSDLLELVVSSEVDASVVPLRHRRISRKASGLAVAAVLVLGAGAAAAAGSGALTGVFGQRGYTENDASEYVNPLSPQYPALEKQLFQQLLSEGLRLPPNVKASQVIDNVVNQGIASTKRIEHGTSAMDKSLRTHGMRVQVTGIKGTFAGAAQCAWEYYWVDANRAGNGSHEAAAIRGMASLNDVITSTPTANGTHTGSIMAETNRKKTLIQDVRLMQHGDLSFFERDTSVNCANSGQ